MNLQGRAWKFGANVDTDVIIPVRYLTSIDPVELGRHCLEGLDPEFAQKVRPGDIIVAAENFGCGSSREHAPVAIKGAGVGCVIAATFARIFFRNALNIGLPIVECAEAAQRIDEGDTVEVDVMSGRVINHTKGETYQAAPFPPFVQELIAVGGLVPYVARRLQERAGTVEGA
ncbi:MAG TPA: 3-isopropylmalate dehydratase small subunit [Alphaproteobacteria bacterium]|nr:3-isopropylmalate dehydratase small subunit [Alphaproteobacteria bacterium]